MKTRYRARKNPWPFAVLCLLTAAAGAALGYAAFYLRFSPLYLVSFSAFMFAAQMFSVFVLPAYDYELDGPFLRIYRTAGRSSLCVFDVDLSLASAILPYAEYKAGRKKRRGGKKLVCLCGVRRKHAYALTYGDRTLIFAPDQDFAEAVGKIIISGP